METHDANAAELELGADAPPLDMLDETPDELVDPVPAPKPRAPKRPQVARSSVISEMQITADRGLRDYIQTISGGVPVRVNITRKKPMLGPNGERIAGSLETCEELIDEEYIRETWGGGDYMLRISTQRSDGQFKWFRNVNVTVAGKPKMQGKLLDEPIDAVPTNGNGTGHDSMTERAFSAMTNLAQQERDRAERAVREAAKPAPGIDYQAIQAMQAPMLEELRALRDANAQLQLQIIAQAQKPPPRDEFRDTMMSKMVEGESARIEALRIGYDQRIEKMRDNHEDAIKRLDDRHRDEIRRIEDAHKRELSHVEKSGSKDHDTTKQGYEMRIDTLKETIARLERELGALQNKNATLEAKKDQTIGEKADELIKVKEALDGLGGDDGDDKDKPWYERVIDGVGNSEAALAFISKLSGGQPKPGQQQLPPGQQQQNLPPPGIPFQTGDGNIYVRDNQNRVSIIDQRQMKQRSAINQARQQRRVPAPGQPPQAPPPGAANANAQQAQEQPPPPDAIQQGLDDDESDSAEDALLELDENDVKIALSFMENAIKNGTPPEKFAQSARSLVPGNVIAFLQQYGVRKLLGLVKLDAHSPLTSTKGRQFADKVARVLIGEA